jgi:hypothetical protein
MTKPLIENIENFFVKDEHNFFFDANVWIFIEYPSINSQTKDNLKKQEYYSDLLRNIDYSSSKIIINNILLNEIYKVIIYDYFKKFKIMMKMKNLDFKIDFRPSSYYQKALKAAVSTLETILNYENITWDNSIQMKDKFLQEFSSLNNMNLNDFYFLEICNENNFIYVSDDFDNTSYNKAVNILTANAKSFKPN